MNEAASHSLVTMLFALAVRGCHTRASRCSAVCLRLTADDGDLLVVQAGDVCVNFDRHRVNLILILTVSITAWN